MTPTTQHYEQSQIDHVRSLAQSGDFTREEISELSGVALTSVHTYLRGPAPIKRQCSKETRAAVIQEVRQGLDTRAAAEKYGVSYGTVMRWLRSDTPPAPVEVPSEGIPISWVPEKTPYPVLEERCANLEEENARLWALVTQMAGGKQ